MELHGGTVSCFSAGAGQGSTFRVALPRLTEANPPQPDEVGFTRAPQHRAPLRVLLVDDNADAAMMLGMLLEASGYAVTVVHYARHALERVEQQSFDVCLLDIGLPEMDGNALARHLRGDARTAACVLVAITGYGQESDRQNSAQAGFDHHFIKPVDSQKLLSLLASVA